MKKRLKKIKNKIKKRIKAIVKYISFKWVFPVYFNYYKKKPLNEKLVVFADARDREMPDNFVGLYKMCQERGYQCVFMSGSQYSDSLPKWTRRWGKVRFQFRFMKLYAVCKATFLVEYFDLAYIVKPREGTELVQLWHACGAFKTMGYAASPKAWGSSAKIRKRYPSHQTYTLCCVSSEKSKTAYMRAFRCDESVYQLLGAPRTDVFFDEDFKRRAREKVKKLFPEIGDRKIVLYAPTIRGKDIKHSYINDPLNYVDINNAIGDRYVMLTKYHPQMAKGGMKSSQLLRNPNFLFDVTHALSADEAICVADILITDYSSMMFEYLLFERPIISFIYDFDEYDGGRGFFFPYNEIAPGPYVFDEEELIEKLQTVDQWFDVERIREYKQRYMSACDGHCTERIFRYVFEPQTREKNVVQETTTI